MRSVIVSFLLLISFSCFYMKDQPSDKNQELGMKINEFAFKIFLEMDKKEGNVFLSPFSITSAFSLAYAGAKGETKEEFMNTFNFSSSQNEHHHFFNSLIKKNNAQKSANIEFNIANAIWGQKNYKLKKKYVSTLKKYYDTQLNELDFKKKAESAKKINDWVSNITKKQIEDLVNESDIDENTQLYITNAIFFKGNWSNAFDPKNTQKGMFHVDKEEKVKADFMTHNGIYKTYVSTSEKDPLSILEIPYDGNAYSMLILLPDYEKDISHLLNSDNYTKWLSSLQKRKFDVIKIPKFKLNEKTDLKKVLGSMGMKNAFSDNANFAGISPAENLYISDASHNAVITVNEEGSKAAGSTAIGMASRSALKKTFIANRPFLFIIKNNTNNNILFIGKIEKPEYE